MSLFSCNQKKAVQTQFQSLKPKHTQINFNNKISETEKVNYFSYPYLYMGGGVAIGDINNDGLQDLYFTANMHSNKLYLNQGNMVFKDISESAGVQGDDRWTTGVTFSDFNNDGWSDIYVSVSGKWTTTKNLLYINNGDLTFTEKAEELGLADEGNSTQASLLDYDNDGDLDVYVANYPPLDFKSPNFVYSQNMKTPQSRTSDHLYRNDEGMYIDVTKEAGILNFGLSLSATTSDLNNDGWPDIYVSNDFASPDFIYLNNQDGTFSEQSKEITNHTSYYGMGVDIADINNDGLYDILQVDMTPSDNYRSKTNMASMDIDGFNDMISLGLHYQYMENALQLNMGIEAGAPIYSDVSRKAGIALTDWSWSPLIVDFDNDGLKDIHITNGTKRDINNKDYFIQLRKSKEKMNQSDLQKTLNIPSQKISNYTFKNIGQLSFQDVSNDWGMGEKTFSNGSAFGDLDNDGDLDLVINNIDAPASILKNNADQNWFQVACIGSQNNLFGIGAEIKITTPSGKQYFSINNTRGFQSSSQPIAHFGLGQDKSIQELLVIWPDGKTQTLKNIAPNQRLKIQYSDAKKENVSGIKEKLFSKLSEDRGINYLHKENEIVDFKIEVLLPHAISVYGPALCVGDLNNDGIEDVFLGGAKGQKSEIYLQNPEGQFSLAENNGLEADAWQEDVDAIIFDANGDGLNDLYVVSGGNEKEAGSDYYQDRLYINNGKKLIRSNGALPAIAKAGSVVKPFDYDNDGDLDLLVGSKHIPKSYGSKASSILLKNESTVAHPKFINATDYIAPSLNKIGLVNDLIWSDFNGDGKVDIILVGEWMPITFLKNNGEIFEDITSEIDLKNNTGWWQSIESGDLDNDGDTDYIVGNLGENYKYKASTEEPFELFLDDFDENGKTDIVLGYYNDGIQYPLRGRQCSSEQIPDIKNKFANYEQFASASLIDVYGKDAINNVQSRLSAQTFSSVMLINDNNGSFDIHNLPVECQLSSINEILIADFDQDKNIDIITAGNMFGSEVETKRNDASIGQFLKGDGNGNYTPLPYSISGININKDIKKVKSINSGKENLLIIANNNEKIEILKLNN